MEEKKTTCLCSHVTEGFVGCLSPVKRSRGVIVWSNLSIPTRQIQNLYVLLMGVMMYPKTVSFFTWRLGNRIQMALRIPNQRFCSQAYWSLSSDGPCLHVCVVFTEELIFVWGEPACC